MTRKTVTGQKQTGNRDTTENAWDAKRYARHIRREDAAPVNRIRKLHDVLCDATRVERMLEHMAVPRAGLVHAEDSFFVECLLPHRKDRSLDRISRDRNGRWGYYALPRVRGDDKQQRATKAKGRSMRMEFGEVYAAWEYRAPWPMNDLRMASLWNARLAVESGAYLLERSPLPSLDLAPLLQELRSVPEVVYVAFVLDAFALRIDIAREFVPKGFRNAGQRIAFSQAFMDGGWVHPDATMMVPDADRRWTLFWLLVRHGLIDRIKVETGVPFPPRRNLFRFVPDAPTRKDPCAVRESAVAMWQQLQTKRNITAL